MRHKLGIGLCICLFALLYGCDDFRTRLNNNFDNMIHNLFYNESPVEITATCENLGWEDEVFKTLELNSREWVNPSSQMNEFTNETAIILGRMIGIDEASYLLLTISIDEPSALEINKKYYFNVCNGTRPKGEETKELQNVATLLYTQYLDLSNKKLTKSYGFKSVEGYFEITEMHEEGNVHIISINFAFTAINDEEYVMVPQQISGQTCYVNTPNTENKKGLIEVTGKIEQHPYTYYKWDKPAGKYF